MTFPERTADRLIDELEIRDPKDLRLLEEIAFARKAVIVDQDLRGMEARLTVVKGRALIAVSTKITNPQRRRFSITHELGHFEIHPKVSSYSLCTQADINEESVKEQGKQREQEANSFASSFLLPKRFFSSLCQQDDPSLDLIAQLASEFDCSLTATGLRFTQFCDEPVALVFSQDSVMRWFRASPSFEELGLFIDIKGKLDPATLAALFFKQGYIPSKPHRSPISTWIEPGRHQSDATILEQSYAIPSQRGVLTLLWIDEEMDEDEYHDWG